jgi:hypothetical protein
MLIKQPQINKVFVSFALACLIIGGTFGDMGGRCNAAIVYPKAPDGGRQIVYKYLEADSKPHNFLDFLGVSRIEDLTISEPYGDYGVDTLTNLASGKLLSTAKLYGWYYFLMNGTNAVGAMSLHPDIKSGKTLKFGELTRGLVLETTEALRKAEELPQVKKHDYELRSLNNPSILFRAVWLHGESDDIIIPLPPTWGRWNAYQPYSESQMVKLLRPEVEKKLKEPAGMVD